MKTKVKIKLPAKLENIEAFLEAVTTFSQDQGIDPKRIPSIELSIEEVLVNIINHAYKGNPGNAEITCGLDDHERLIIQIVDTGLSFNFAALDEPDIAAGIEDRKTGGLGVFLIKKLMDDVHYRRENGRNILTLTVVPNRENG